jgi:hypothetical protein
MAPHRCGDPAYRAGVAFLRGYRSCLRRRRVVYRNAEAIMLDIDVAHVYN